jgi:hypothetical protein
MALDLRDCSFFGPALPEPFVKFDLERELNKRNLLRKRTGSEGKALEAAWELIRRQLRELGDAGGPQRVANRVFEPLLVPLGYSTWTQEEKVATREGDESGGWLMSAAASKLRVWAVEVNTDLDAPRTRGHAYRFSPVRIAERVLLAKNERVGLLTDGDELRLLLCDPARPNSHVAIRLDRASGWRGSRNVPDSFRLLLALASPNGIGAVPEIVDAARLGQAEVTETLRKHARVAVEAFIQELIDRPENRVKLSTHTDRDSLARSLWREGLIVVYRLLFIFKLEASPDPARAFSFNTSTLWRNTFSPSTALARFARLSLEGHQTGSLLEKGLRALFAMFAGGLRCAELTVSPLDGVLFGRASTTLIDDLVWGELAVAKLLDRLLWTEAEGKKERMRVHYGPLDVEDLGRVYEALLELEPGLASEAMVRLKRDKLEVVVPKSQGEKYRSPARPAGASTVEFVEDIPEGKFFLRVGLGRKATGSYYTPHAFVRFLVQETIGPLVAKRSPKADPQPIDILQLKVIDPAMGSGHFLVEACRYLGERLYEACRLCDELASGEEEKASQAKSEHVRQLARSRAGELRRRVQALPDPNDEILAYLPSRTLESEEMALSQARALALCRRLVAVHSLYGVDKNPLAVELAKVTLWLESFAEGLPLTFLDHRLVCGDSLTGPFFEDLVRHPGTGQAVEGLFAQGLREQLQLALRRALLSITELESSIGVSVADVELKLTAKRRFDAAMAPFKQLSRHWTQAAAKGTSVVNGRTWENVLEHLDGGETSDGFGADALAFDLQFPEVFFGATRGFDVVLGNPPWDRALPADREFFSAFDIAILESENKAQRTGAQEHLLENPSVRRRYDEYRSAFDGLGELSDRLYRYQDALVDGEPTIGKLDLYRLFIERTSALLGLTGRLGLVVPSAFHANEGATGVRRLLMRERQLECCFSFENAKKLFDIDSRFKFAVIVASATASVERNPIRCSFYLRDPTWLFSPRDPLVYRLDFIEKTGGEHLSLLELRSKLDEEVAKITFWQGSSFGQWCDARGLRLGRELNISDDAFRFTETSEVLATGEDPRDPKVAEKLREMGYLPLHEGKTFHQYTDRWEDRPRYLIALDKLMDKPGWLEAARFYRLAFRKISSSTNERTSIACLLPPAVLCGDSAPCERSPDERPDSAILTALALMNSFVFDWNLRQKSSANVNHFILNGVPVPKLTEPGERFLVHGALCLSCNHRGYDQLWAEQLPAVALSSFPVLVELDARWRVVAAMDAVIASAYGLSSSQYEHVLRNFSHTSYPAAKDLCLTAFDELKSLGWSKFAKKYDPFSTTAVVRTGAVPLLVLRPKNAAQPLELNVSLRAKRVLKRS